MFLHIAPSEWIISDVNKDLINIWETIKSEPSEIIDYFREFAEEFKELDKESKIKMCREITSGIEQSVYDKKRAKQFLLMKQCVYMGHLIIRNRFQFPGLEMNIYINNKYPFLQDSYYDNIVDIGNFLNTSNRIILNNDYKDVLRMTEEEDFVFLDPPYMEPHKYDFNYNQHEVITDDLLADLRDAVKMLDLKNVMWMMTQADTPQVRETFKDYRMETLRIYRNASKQYKNKLLIMNYMA